MMSDWTCRVLEKRNQTKRDNVTNIPIYTPPSRKSGHLSPIRATPHETRDHRLTVLKLFGPHKVVYDTILDGTTARHYHTQSPNRKARETKQPRRTGSLELATIWGSRFLVSDFHSYPIQQNIAASIVKPNASSKRHFETEVTGIGKYTLADSLTINSGQHQALNNPPFNQVVTLSHSHNSRPMRRNKHKGSTSSHPSALQGRCRLDRL
ncbi:hypothetical protein NM208_g5843 [Fusarium decemcellulare]|uniref:Uncharacterized protein n=2 Tax=Fusarium decemcellulare TaxID=57161 RepID=A0ACC1SFB0_9HYPO|nr:hypothetical protein NM208_g6308 [Fusarium decemcellulare]KAJ3538584.1 hypothetical protein NM208_g5843 [Fusarium decemcellulare]